MSKVKEIPFSLPVTGVIRIDGHSVKVIVSRTSTNVSLKLELEPAGHTGIEPGVSLFDVLLEAAREFVARKKYNRFTGPQLYQIAQEKYPGLNKRSFMTRLTAATPNHPSYRHHISHRDYFSRIAPGMFTLENRYLPKKAPQEAFLSDIESSRDDDK
jgi:hypothetical protein